MKKILLATLFAVGLSVPAFAGNLDLEVVQPTVMIDNDCSATVIQSKKEDDKYDTKLITAKHCVKDRENGLVIIPVEDKGLKIGIKAYTYEVQRKSTVSDLALLRLRDTDVKFPVATIAKELKVEQGEPVVVAGFPLAMTKTVTNGTFNGFQNLDEKSNNRHSIYFRASPPMTFGNSGGGLYQIVDGHYEYIGTTSMKFRENHFMNLFVKLEDIRNFLGALLEESVEKVKEKSVTDTMAVPLNP